MRKVKYIPVYGQYIKLTSGKVYDVIDYIKYDDDKDVYIQLVNDEGNSDSFCVYADGTAEFIEVSAEFRNAVIDGILS